MNSNARDFKRKVLPIANTLNKTGPLSLHAVTLSEVEKTLLVMEEHGWEYVDNKITSEDHRELIETTYSDSYPYVKTKVISDKVIEKYRTLYFERSAPLNPAKEQLEYEIACDFDRLEAAQRRKQLTNDIQNRSFTNKAAIAFQVVGAVLAVIFVVSLVLLIAGKTKADHFYEYFELAGFAVGAALCGFIAAKLGHKNRKRGLPGHGGIENYQLLASIERDIDAKADQWANM